MCRVSMLFVVVVGPDWRRGVGCDGGATQTLRSLAVVVVVVVRVAIVFSANHVVVPGAPAIYT